VEEMGTVGWRVGWEAGQGGVGRLRSYEETIGWRRMRVIRMTKEGGVKVAPNNYPSIGFFIVEIKK
jgi:hypothetical protein